MPEMVRLERLFCRSASWRLVARSVVLPWALQGALPQGRVLEIGGGSGAMAAAIAERFPAVSLTMVDVDAWMVTTAAERLSPYGDRVTARQRDATALPFPDANFDMALSFLMLHHVGDWALALAELVRVLEPGGSIVGYDLLDAAPVRMLHRIEGETVAAARAVDLRRALHDLRLQDVRVRVSPGGLLARFSARRG